MIHTLPILTEGRPLTTHTLTDTEKIHTGLSCIFCVHIFKTARNILDHAWNLIFYFIITCLHSIDHFVVGFVHCVWCVTLQIPTRSLRRPVQRALLQGLLRCPTETPTPSWCGSHPTQCQTEVRTINRAFVLPHV